MHSELLPLPDFCVLPGLHLKLFTELLSTYIYKTHPREQYELLSVVVHRQEALVSTKGWLP